MMTFILVYLFVGFLVGLYATVELFRSGFFQPPHFIGVVITGLIWPAFIYYMIFGRN